MQPALKKGLENRKNKIFESLEITATKRKFESGNVSTNITIQNLTLIFLLRNYKSRSNNSFTMESLILAQDER